MGVGARPGALMGKGKQAIDTAVPKFTSTFCLGNELQYCNPLGGVRGELGPRHAVRVLWEVRLRLSPHGQTLVGRTSSSTVLPPLE